MRTIEQIEQYQDGMHKAIQKLRAKVLDLAIHGKLVPQDPKDEPAIEILKRINPNYVPCDTSHYEQLPKGWLAIPLKETGIIVLNGFAFKSSLYSPSGIKVIRITNVQDGFVCDDDPKYYSVSHLKEIEKYLLFENDLLMSLTGNVGRVGFLPKEMTPAALNQRVGCLRGGDEIIDKTYLYYYLQCETFKKDCIKSAKGSAQLNISTEWLKTYVILLPPFSEQKRIIQKIKDIFAILDSITEEL